MNGTIPSDYTPPENPTKIEELSEEALKDLGRRMSQGEIFTHLHLNEGDGSSVGMVFMPIALGGLATYDIRQIGLIYEELHKAGPRSVNGYPMFMSVQFLNMEQAPKMLEYYQKYQKAMNEV